MKFNVLRSFIKFIKQKKAALDILIIVLLLNIPLAHSLDIKITKTEIHDDFKEEIDGFEMFTNKYTYLKLKLKNKRNTINSLRVGVINKTKKNDSVVFVYPDKMTGTLPKGIGARLLKFLADGWGGNEVSFSSKAIEEVYGYDLDEYPTCFHVMNYLAFNVRSFYVLPYTKNLFLLMLQPQTRHNLLR